jgi:hypothetical protein
VRINQHLYFSYCIPGTGDSDDGGSISGYSILGTAKVRLSLEYGASRWGTRKPFLCFLETIRCLRSRITWMRRLENDNLVRHVAAVANGLLRMCVDASVENFAFPHRPFRLQAWTWFPIQERRQRLVAAVKGSVSLTNQFDLSEDISIHFSLGKAYLRCGTRVVGNFSATC